MVEGRGAHQDGQGSLEGTVESKIQQLKYGLQYRVGSGE